MLLSDFISLGGSIITVVCTGIAVYQARAAKKYSDALKIAKSRITLLTLAERLRATQDPIGQLPQAVSALRGSKPDITISKIRVEFDKTLGSLPVAGPGSVARELLRSAQLNLDAYEDSIKSALERQSNSELDIDAIRSLRAAIQDCISAITVEAEGLE